MMAAVLRHLTMALSLSEWSCGPWPLSWQIHHFFNHSRKLSLNLLGEEINLNKEMEKFGIYYVYIGLGAIVFGYFQNMLWLRASINQAFRIRTLAFESILKQDIGFFDTNDAGELSSRLAEWVYAFMLINWLILLMFLCFYVLRFSVVAKRKRNSKN